MNDQHDDEGVIEIYVGPPVELLATLDFGKPALKAAKPAEVEQRVSLFSRIVAAWNAFRYPSYYYDAE